MLGQRLSWQSRVNMFKSRSITAAKTSELDKNLNIKPNLVVEEGEDFVELLEDAIESSFQAQPNTYVTQLAEVATDLDKMGLHKLADMADILVLDALNCQQSAIDSILDSYKTIHQVKTAQVKKDDYLTIDCPFGLPIPQACRYVGMAINMMNPEKDSFQQNKLVYNKERTHETCPFAAKILANDKSVDCNYGTSTEGKITPKMYHGNPCYPMLWQAFSIPSSGTDRGYQAFHDFNYYSIN
jgi:hypothetical protein